MPHTYLITGASSGIGAMFAQELASMGNNLILIARRLDRLEALKEQINKNHNVKIDCIECDLSNRKNVETLIEEIKKRQLSVDGLINNAGFSVAREFTNTKIEEQINFLETCIIAPTILCHAFLPDMQKNNFGRIINVSSIVAFANGAAGHSLYGAAKSYILKMSRSLAAENFDYNINILALCPGPTISEFQINNGMAQKFQKGHRIKPMSAQLVVNQALNANKTKKEVLVNGLINRISVFILKYFPEFIINPIIRKAARKLLIK